MLKRTFPRNLTLLIAAALIAAQAGAHAQLSGRHEKLALSSETDPFGGTYDGIDLVVYNNAGLATFYKRGIFGASRVYQGTLAKVDRGFDAPNFNEIDKLDSNASGQIAFTRSNSLYVATTSGFTTIALSTSVAPGGGNFDTISNGFSMNDAGQVAFFATTSGGPGQGIYLHTGAGIVSLARLAGTAPGGGTFSSVGTDVALNSSGQVVFTGATSGGPASGLYLATNSAGHLLASVSPNTFMLNDAGQVAFVAGGAIHLATLNGDVAIVSSGDNAPGGGTFSGFGDPVLNQLGQVAFTASTNGGPGSGVYLWKPGGLSSVALQGPAPGGGNFTSFGRPVLNNAGQVAFSATTGGGSLICFGDGTDFFKVIGAGDSLLGVSITGVSLPPPALVPGHGPVNDSGQVAYRAIFSNNVSGIFIFSPGLHWHTAGAGGWDTAANWTASIQPGAKHDVAIDPALDTVVTGPAANTTVRSLLVGGGAGAVTLNLQNGVTLTTAAGMSLAANATLAGTGTIGGNLTLLAGTHVALKLGGPVRGTDYDFLKVTGKTTLIGTLDVTLDNGLVLHGRDSFDLLDLASRSGKFVTVNLPPLAPGLTWDTSKLYTTGAITVSMATFFAVNQGKYAGLVSANAPAFASTGSLALKLDQGGGFSGTLKMGGKSYPVHGALDDTGFFSGSLGKTDFVLTLQLDLLNATDQFTATITQNGLPFSAATIDRAPTGFTKANPVARAGSYTVVLPADPAHPEATYPHSAGYGSLVVAPTGAVKLTGVLGDLTTASPAGVLSKNDEFSVYLPLYGGKGYLSGVLTLRDAAAANHVEGTLHWFKPQNTAKTYPAAFSGDITVAGSHYISPPLQPQILPAGAATFTISDGNVTMTPAKNLTVAVGNAVTNTGADKFSLKFTAKTGIFGGTFLDADSISRAFKGAFLQKQNVGKGVFKGVNQTGKIELQPQ